MSFDYTPPSVDIPVPRSEGFKVRGLNMDDISHLIFVNLDEVVLAAEYYQKHRDSVFTKDGLAQALIILSRGFPALTSEILEVASDRWGTAAQMRQLPAGVQMAALGEVLKMTLEDLGGLKNTFGLLAEVVRGAMRAADVRTTHKSPSAGSSLDSEVR